VAEGLEFTEDGSILWGSHIHDAGLVFGHEVLNNNQSLIILAILHSFQDVGIEILLVGDGGNVSGRVVFGLI